MNQTQQAADGTTWIELTPPIGEKLDKLREFFDEHDLLGDLDKRFIRQVFADLLDPRLRVTKFKAAIKKGDGTQEWTTVFTINNRRDFEGKGRTFPDAFLAMVEGFESFINQYAPTN